jgi:periplasmic copper chaperone A
MKLRCLSTLLLLFCAAAHAGVTVNAPWVRPTPDRAATEAYMLLTSSDAAVLREIRSTLATDVVIRVAGAGTKILPQVALPAGVPVALSPDAMHLVLRGLAHPLAVGERVPLFLTIESANGALLEVQVNAEVRMRSPLEDVRPARKN